MHAILQNMSGIPRMLGSLLGAHNCFQHIYIAVPAYNACHIAKHEWHSKNAGKFYSVHIIFFNIPVYIYIYIYIAVPFRGGTTLILSVLPPKNGTAVSSKRIQEPLPVS